MRLTHPILLAASLLLFLDPASGQTTKESPVFKRPGRTERVPLIRPADPVYQSLQTFLVARRAAAGDPLAQHELGIRYLLGSGVQADTVQAALWISRAADRELPSARFNLAILQYNGWGVPWNPFESYRSLQVCATRGMREAEYFYALFFLEGYVVPQNVDTAVAWVRRAADAGFTPAKELLPRLEEYLRSVEQARSGDRPDTSGLAPFVPVTIDVAPDSGGVDALASSLQTALEGADPDLQRALGFPTGTDQLARLDTADLRRIRTAADAGSPEALTLLGRCAELGVLVPKDRVAALAFYVRAVRMDGPRAPALLWSMLQDSSVFGEMKERVGLNDNEAMYAWASLSALGFDGVLAASRAYVTPPQALAFLRKSSAGGYVPATIELALAYYAGRWVPVDAGEADRLLMEASRGGSVEAGVRRAVTIVRSDTSQERRAEAIGVLLAGASAGSVLAETALGFCLERGLGVPVNHAEAARYYRSAARRGSKDASRALLRMHDRIRPAGKEYTVDG